MKGLQANIPDLEEPWPICLLTKVTKINRDPTTDISKFAPGFMLQMAFVFFIVEIIRGFTSTFVALCFDNSFPFGYTSRNKCSTLDILKLLVTTLRKQYKKFAFVWVDEYGALARYSEIMNA